MSTKSLLYWGYLTAALGLIACGNQTNSVPLAGGTGGSTGDTQIVKDGVSQKPTEAPPSIVSGGLFGGKPTGGTDTTGPKAPPTPLTPTTPPDTVPATDGSGKRVVHVTSIVVDAGIFKKAINIMVPIIEKKSGDKYTACEFDKGHEKLSTSPADWKGLPIYFNEFPKDLEAKVKPTQVDEKDASFRLDVELGKGYKIPLQVRNVVDEKSGCIVFLELKGKDFGISNGRAITGVMEKFELKTLSADVQPLNGPNKTPSGDVQSYTF